MSGRCHGSVTLPSPPPPRPLYRSISVLAVPADMRRLHTALQRYAWGKRGSDSRVAQLRKVHFNRRFYYYYGGTHYYNNSTELGTEWLLGGVFKFFFVTVASNTS